LSWKKICNTIYYFESKNLPFLLPAENQKKKISFEFSIYAESCLKH
jgi:hypothetical protein